LLVKVSFRRTGPRRYAVILERPGQAAQAIDPAPFYDDDIPHDLVHYVVEAELALASGVFGRAAKGGGTFIPSQSGSARDRARQRRKQQRREQSLRDLDEGANDDMATSERLAALSDLAWRRRHAQQPDLSRSAPAPQSVEDEARVERVVSRLSALAPLWRALPVDGELSFVWPGLEASTTP
jgi:hypothetical protein